MRSPPAIVDAGLGRVAPFLLKSWIVGKALGPATVWDKLFDQEKEWLAIRGLIAGAIPRGAASIKRAKNRALLLIKA